MTHLLQEALAFFDSYKKAVLDSKSNLESASSLYKQFVSFVQEQIQNPYQFTSFHKAIRKPFDYYQFGLDFMRPLIDFKHSTLQGVENLKTISSTLKKKENVILFSNHQSEIDPQVISLMIEKEAPELAQEM